MRKAFQLGAAAVLLLGVAVPAFAHKIEKRFSVKERPVVIVRNAHGKVAVKSWPKPEVLVIADHASEKAEVDVGQFGNRIEMTTHLLSEKVTPEELGANYEITVPEESELQIRNDSGTIVVERVSGDLTFDTVTGEVELQEVAGYLVIRTVGGSLVCTRCAGRIEVTSISGDIRLIRPLSSSIRANTSSGSILFDGDFLSGGTYFLRTYSGPIEVRFAENASFELNATSLYGAVDKLAALKPPTHARTRSMSRLGSSLFGTYNEGHAKVELTSFNGTIKVRKRE